MLTDEKINAIANDIALMLRKETTLNLVKHGVLYNVWDIAEKHDVSLEVIAQLLESGKINELISQAQVLELLGLVNENK